MPVEGCQTLTHGVRKMRMHNAVISFTTFPFTYHCLTVIVPQLLKQVL